MDDAERALVLGRWSSSVGRRQAGCYSDRSGPWSAESRGRDSRRRPESGGFAASRRRHGGSIVVVGVPVVTDRRIRLDGQRADDVDQAGRRRPVDGDDDRSRQQRIDVSAAERRVYDITDVERYWAIACNGRGPI